MKGINGDPSKVQGLMEMEYGSEDCLVKGGDGKKLSRMEKNHSGLIVDDALGGRDRGLLVRGQLLSTTAKGCGDFNEIMYSFEKVGDIPREERRMKDALIQHLPHSYLGHCSLLMHIEKEGNGSRRKRFRFEAWWTMEDSFEGEKGLGSWTRFIKNGRNGLKRELTRKLEEIMDKERNVENLDWGTGTYFSFVTSLLIRMSTIKCLEHGDGRGVKDEGQMEDESVERALAKSCKTVKCVPPTRSVIEINFDAAFDNHLSRSGSGIVARNAMGEVLVSRSILHDDIGFVFAAKALVFSWAVQTGVEMGLLEDIIEGDSLSIIKKF
ncbi:hypothetical protein Gotur_026040 [Gossypium turneri]